MAIRITRRGNKITLSPIAVGSDGRDNRPLFRMINGIGLSKRYYYNPVVTLCVDEDGKEIAEKVEFTLVRPIKIKGKEEAK